MNIEEISFAIISHAGDAFANLRIAIQHAKKKEFEECDNAFLEAKKGLSIAHDVHAKLLSIEANGEKCEYSILLAHAEDTLMNTILFETIAEEFIDMYKNK